MSSKVGLARWEHPERRPISDEMIADFRSDAKFSDACRYAVLSALKQVKADPVQHANFRDIGRMVVGTLALFMHASGGLTHRRLCELSSEGGQLSSGRATAILLRLRMIGYVTAAAKRSDGSARLYYPTEKMIGAFRGRTRVELEALAMMTPEAGEIAKRLDEPQVFFALYRMIGQRLMFATANKRTDLEIFEKFVMRDAGMLVFYALFEMADTGGAFPPIGPVKVSLAALARRFSVSRTHVLRLLRDAEKDGFVTRDTSGDFGILTPLLHEKFCEYYATIVVALGAMAHQTLQEINAPKASLSA